MKKNEIFKIMADVSIINSILSIIELIICVIVFLNDEKVNIY